jgi:hypothetical protein
MVSVGKSHLIQEGNEVVRRRPLAVPTGAVLGPHVPKDGFQLTCQWPATEQFVPEIDVLQPPAGNQNAMTLFQPRPEALPRFVYQPATDPNVLV